MNKVKFDKDIILEKSFEIAVKEGFGAISVRKIAQDVGCSTSPIYTAFNNVEGLITATLRKAINLIKEIISKEYTQIEFLNNGVGLLVFARDYPKLYREIFIDNINHVIENEIRELFLDLLYKDPVSKFMSDQELEEILIKTWFFTHGLATSICSQSIDVKDEHEFVQMLGEVGKDLIITALMRNGKLKSYHDFLIRENKQMIESTFNWSIWKENIKK